MLAKLFKVSPVLMVLISLATAPNLVLAAPAHQGETCALDYTVQADDWLSKIAEKQYGDPLAYPVIAEATNAAAEADSSYATIANADLIEPGWRLCIPSLEDAQTLLGETAAPAAAPGRLPMASGRVQVRRRHCRQTRL